MTESQFLFHTANVVFLLAYAVRGMLPLRLLAIVGNLLAIAFYLMQPQVSAVHIAWTLVYIAIHVFHAGLLLYERRPVRLNADEQLLYRRVFRMLTPAEFKKLLKLVVWRNCEARGVLAGKGEMLEGVSVIVDGNAEVVDGGRAKAVLGPGNFIGEMSFVKGEGATADVVALTPLRYALWRKDDLGRFLKRHAALREAWHVAIGEDLVDKLMVRQVAG